MDDSHVDKLAEQASDLFTEKLSIENLTEINKIQQKIKREENNSKSFIKLATKQICNACGHSFKNLGRHLESHGPLNCMDCLLHFATKKLYNEHIRLSHATEDDSYNCNICKLCFPSITKLAIHNYKHTDEYTCPICNFTVKGKHKHSLVNHIKRHEGQYSVYCEVCGQGFMSKHFLASHMEIHEDIPKYECEFCMKKFTVKRYLEVHKSLNHKKEMYGIEETFQCEICGRSFSFEKSLVRHLSAIHKIGEDRTVDCPVCEKKIANNHNLKVHMRIHTGEKRFCCDTCGKAFSEKKYLQKHQVTHHSNATKKSRKKSSGLKELEFTSSASLVKQEYFICSSTDEEGNENSNDIFYLYP